MKKYFYITAIALPIVTGSAWAQETTIQPTDQAPVEQTEGETPDAGMAGDAPAAGDMATESAPVEGIAAESSDSETTVAPSDAVVPQQDSAEMLGDWLLSTSVTSPDGVTIGSIKDFIITEDGQITAVILGVGGFLGIGEKDIAVDYSQLDIQYDGNAIQLAMTREEADAAPEYQYRDKETPPPATGDAMGATGTDMNSETGMTGDEAGTMGAAPTE
ncbi:PRC-barrel domain-containing protein [Salipiger sp. PrR002]|uniref:PRC-barrel domain-containing protein n=1 Tax=Salipiger sp. PrR002 TaxID=2706489 RepID=UPI0013BAD850|nr:PRC-barrel domain-containing protein [Salipiger sp. PrR002]NDW02731.1 PRC-barrel domain containing protein [Salipiger sp. PrR002]NDW59983.1 PRC-barrel domain containing protein [Salipiger sp. PrR004]